MENKLDTKQVESKKEVKKESFIDLKNLESKDVKNLPVFSAKLKRSINRSGLSTSITLMLNELNLPISLVSSIRTSNGKSQQLRYFQPDVFIALILELGLPQEDELGKTKNDWSISAAVRFVKGKIKNSDKEYHSIEVIFKQYKYHVHFLTPHQLTILEMLAKQGKLVDKKGNKVKLDWIERPEAIDDFEDTDTVFDFQES